MLASGLQPALPLPFLGVLTTFSPLLTLVVTLVVFEAERYNPDTIGVQEPRPTDFGSLNP